MQNLQVDIQQNNIKYNIFFSEDILGILKENIADIENKKLFFVIDDNVFCLYQKEILEFTKELNVILFTIKHGEENKNYKTVFEIIDSLIEHKITRKDYIIALGGGVTGDITGFACSLFKRGAKLVQIPTTLLSMLDSSVGGKTGVDYKGIKNLIGSFYNPNFVIINKNFLKTLPEREIISGYFEGIKHSILTSKQDFQDFNNSIELLKNQDNSSELDEIILKNISFKLKVVESDPFETNGKRRVLNYGHTFGHALETFMNFEVSHGACVGFGIIFANILSYQKGYLNINTYEIISKSIKNTLKNINLGELDFETIYLYMLNDKKNLSKNVKFILLKDFGTFEEYDANEDEIKDVFEEFII